MKAVCRTIALWFAVALAGTVPDDALGFGGEDLALGNPWHHVDITMRALTDRDPPIYDTPGFSADAASAIAWHADHLDSYMYNPIWWVSGDEWNKRIKAALVGYEELPHLHFDDIFTPEGVIDAWTRYASGTLIGLAWAAEREVNGIKGDVLAALHVLGVSLHAVQDFYSHSNWVDDPERRCATWFDLPVAERDDVIPLYSGRYEAPLSAAPHDHGTYSLSCSALSGQNLDDMWEVVCHAYSPFQNYILCEKWRLCSASEGVTVSVAAGPTDDLVRLNPPGIALDSIWLSRVQAQNRSIVDSQGKFLPDQKSIYYNEAACNALTGATGRSKPSDLCKNDADLVFAGAKDLAIRGSIEWIAWIDAAMQSQGSEMIAFWNRVKNWKGTGNENSNELLFVEDFEDFARLGYQFLSVGPYPVGNPSRDTGPDAVTSDGWYLRVRVRTGTGIGDGTDADIYLDVTLEDGSKKPVRLDYLPTDDPTAVTDTAIFVYDDFEAGDDDVYAIGPFAARPVSIQFRNDDSDVVDVGAALGASIGNSILESGTDARRAAITVLAGGADYVGRSRRYLTYEHIVNKIAEARSSDGKKDENRSIGRQGVDFYDSQIVDGGDEGIYEVEYHVRILESEPNLTREQIDNKWIAVEIRTSELITKRESKFDRGTDSDEPFLIVTTSPLVPGAKASNYVSNPFDDADTGDAFPIGREPGSFSIVKLAPDDAVLIAAEVYESDSENEFDRDLIGRMIESGYGEDVFKPTKGFLDELGQALGPDWSLNRVSVYGFYRGASPLAGTVLPFRSGMEVEGGKTSDVYQLDWSDARTLIPPELSIGEYQSEIRSPWLPDREGYELSARPAGSLSVSVGKATNSIETRRCPAPE